MRDRKKRNIIIGVLCSLVVFMGIGYAILSQTLSISGMANMKGDWNIKITDITQIELTGKAVNVSNDVSQSGLSASFEVDLYMPGDSAVYSVTVTNRGNIDASLKELVPTVENEVQSIKFTNNATQGKVLKSGEEYTFQVRVEFDEDATKIPESAKTNTPKYIITLNFVQYTGNELYTPTNTETDNSCFVIDTAGTITGYDYNCGTVVTIPESIDGIQVKNITQDTFVDSNALGEIWYYVNETDGKSYYVFKDQTAKDMFLESEEITEDDLKEMEENENIYTYIKGDSALANIDLGTLDAKVYIYRTSEGLEARTEDELDISSEASLVPLTELDLSKASYLEKMDFVAAPSLKKLNLDLKNPVIFGQVVAYGTETDEDLPFGTAFLLDELVINADVFNNTKPTTITIADTTGEIPAFYFTGIKKLMVLDGTTHKIETSTSADENGLGFRKIINLVIEDGITDIGEDEFVRKSIKTLSLPNTLKTIGSGAFASNQLTNAGLGKLPASLTNLATDAFNGNTNLTQITLTSPKDLTGWPNGGTVNGKSVIYER